MRAFGGYGCAILYIGKRTVTHGHHLVHERLTSVPSESYNHNQENRRDPHENDSHGM